MATQPYTKYVPQKLREIMAEVKSGLLGDPKQFDWLNNLLTSHGDHGLICEDFEEYLKTQHKVDEAYQNRDDWIKKSMYSALGMVRFTSDRTALDYSEHVW